MQDHCGACSSFLSFGSGEACARLENPSTSPRAYERMHEDLTPLAPSEKELGSRVLARQLAAERQRLARHRRASKLVCVTVELRHSEIQALVCQGRLKPSECADRAALPRALHAFLNVYLA
jgi:hypothetical protein